MMNSKPAASGQILKVLVPLLLSCFCVVGTALFSDTGNALFSECIDSPSRGCVHRYIQLYWGMMVLLWGVLLLLSSLVPQHINSHMPLLLIWTVWISLRSDFQLGRLADASLVDQFEQILIKSHWVTLTLLIFASLSLLIRRRVPVFILCMAEVIFLATIPKSSEIKITLMTLQVVYYCVLYFLSLLLMPVKPEPTYILNTAMGSVWALWVNDMLHLTIAVLFYIGLCLLSFATQYESTRVWVNFNRVTVVSNDEEADIKKD